MTWADPEAPELAHELPVSCRDRLCAVCSRIRAFRWAARLRRLREDAEGAGYRVRLLTLTLRPNPEADLRREVSRLYAAFRRLRARAAWRRHVWGFAAFLELSHEFPRGFGPHLHIMIAGKFWAQSEISKLWHAVTGDSFIVDIRRLGKGGEREVAKYVSKVLELAGDALLDVAHALKGRRSVIVGGAWYAASLRLDREQRERSRRGTVQTWASLCGRADAGEAWARVAVRAIVARGLASAPQLDLGFGPGSGADPPG